MKFKHVVISGMANYLPEKVISSDDIEEKLSPIYKKLHLPAGRLELMTGIKERRYWELGTRPSDLATKAATNLFEQSNLNPQDIGIVIHASICRDFLEPATASVVHHNLNLKPSCMLFDLSNACLGMMSSISVVAHLIDSGTIKHGLIVSGENGGPLLFKTIEHLLNDHQLTRKSIKKYIANLTIGSAAVAMTLSHRDAVTDGHLLKGGISLTDSSANTLCQGDGTTHGLMMETDSEELMKRGVALAQETWQQTKVELGWDNSSIDWVFGHQVGKAHENLTMRTLQLEKKRTFNTFPFLGNTGSAALPITLDLLNRETPIVSGSKVALLGIGSGLNSIMYGVEW